MNDASTDLYATCRACLRQNGDFFNLFEAYEHGLTLAEVLQTCIQKDVNEDDSLPRSICESCSFTLTQFYNFWLTYEESEKVLRKLNKDEEGPEIIEAAVETICNVAESDLPPSKLVIDDSKKEEVPVQRRTEFVEKDGRVYQWVTKYRCSFCGEEHLLRTSFEQHVRMKHKTMDIDCKDYASITNINVPDFVKNLTISTGIVNPKPKAKRIKVKAGLYQHTHEASKRFICDICGQGFIRNSYLVDHLEGHGNERKHVCKLCGKTFKRRTVLRAHKRIHTHPQYYICEQCGRAFNNGSVLRTHQLLIHQREQRNFACQICEMTFPLKASLNKHLVRHRKRESGEKGFDCQHCSMQYRDKSSLMRHLKMKHQGKPKSHQKKSHGIENVVMKEEIAKVENCQ